MLNIEIGSKAAAFTLKDTQGNDVSLADFAGKKVLLSWHPLAWTSVCLDQMRSLEVHYEKFKELNTVALGMSVDPVPSKKAWAAAVAIENTPLLSDFWPHGKVAEDYGIFLEGHGFSRRANIIIDEAGIIRWVKVYPMPQLPDINEVLTVLAEME